MYDIRVAVWVLNSSNMSLRESRQERRVELTGKWKILNGNLKTDNTNSKYNLDNITL